MSTLKHTFTTLPEPGFELIDKGFRYVVTAAQPHTNQKGEPSAIVTWRGWCAHDGQPFEFKTGAKVYNLARRCKVHNAGWAIATPYATDKAGPAFDMDRLTTFRSDVLLGFAKKAHATGDQTKVATIRELVSLYDQWLDTLNGTVTADDLFS